MQDAELSATRSAWRREPLVKISAAGQRAMCGASSGARVTAREVDVVHVVQERLRVELVHLHEAGQRRPELAVVALLQIARVLERHVEMSGDEFAHALVDLGEEVAGGG